MANDALTVKVEFDKENAMNCIKNVIMEEYGMALDELAELCKAKQEGRLVELPCEDMQDMEEYINKRSILEKVGSMPLAWEYGQAVSDIYEMIKNEPTIRLVERESDE